jgi:hypothetical protein
MSQEFIEIVKDTARRMACRGIPSKRLQMTALYEALKEAQKRGLQVESYELGVASQVAWKVMDETFDFLMKATKDLA